MRCWMSSLILAFTPTTVPSFTGEPRPQLSGAGSDPSRTGLKIPEKKRHCGVSIKLGPRTRAICPVAVAGATRV